MQHLHCCLMTLGLPESCLCGLGASSLDLLFPVCLQFSDHRRICDWQLCHSANLQMKATSLGVVSGVHWGLPTSRKGAMRQAGYAVGIVEDMHSLPVQLRCGHPS